MLFGSIRRSLSITGDLHREGSKVNEESLCLIKDDSTYYSSKFHSSQSELSN